ncbi:transposase [Bradyrhizobium tunisiense]|uniref:transposase n=1 Tax=Bradyrhizobium tunisiense TaxID=3278709 RepID=UPI0035DB31F9
MVGTPIAIVVAHTCLDVPFVVASESATLAGIDLGFEHAALSLGATPGGTLWRITLPLIRPRVLVEALFAFINSFDEVVVALFLSGRCCGLWEWRSALADLAGAAARLVSAASAAATSGRGEARAARLTLVREQLAALEQSQAAGACVIPAPMAKRRGHLQRLKALGPAFTATLMNEVFYKNFRNRREVASYCGLTPSPWKSRGIDHEQGISKSGNRRARQKAIELAWLWLRQPDSALSCWFRCRGQRRQARRHRRAGAQADRGAVALYHHRACAGKGNDEGIDRISHGCRPRLKPAKVQT